MLVYNEYAETDSLWPEVIEQSWQIMPAKSTHPKIARELASKMPHLGLADILLLAGVVNITSKRVRLGGTGSTAIDKAGRAMHFT